MFVKENHHHISDILGLGATQIFKATKLKRDGMATPIGAILATSRVEDLTGPEWSNCAEMSSHLPFGT